MPHRHRHRSMLTTTAAYFAVFLVGTAVVEWIVIKEQSFGVAPIWQPFVDRLAYLVPLSIMTALLHGGLVEMLGWLRRQRGKSAIRRLTMPITAAIAGVVLMAFPSIPGFFTNLSRSTFGLNSILEFLLVPLGIAILSTTVAIVLGASSGGLRGRQ